MNEGVSDWKSEWMREDNNLVSFSFPLHCSFFVMHRATESAEQIARRLKTSKQELDFANKKEPDGFFDFVFHSTPSIPNDCALFMKRVALWYPQIQERAEEAMKEWEQQDRQQSSLSSPSASSPLPSPTVKLSTASHWDWARPIVGCFSLSSCQPDDCGFHVLTGFLCHFPRPVLLLCSPHTVSCCCLCVLISFMFVVWRVLLCWSLCFLFESCSILDEIKEKKEEGIEPKSETTKEEEEGRVNGETETETEIRKGKNVLNNQRERRDNSSQETSCEVFRLAVFIQFQESSFLCWRTAYRVKLTQADTDEMARKEKTGRLATNDDTETTRCPIHERQEKSQAQIRAEAKRKERKQ